MELNNGFDVWMIHSLVALSGKLFRTIYFDSKDSSALFVYTPTKNRMLLEIEFTLATCCSVNDEIVSEYLLQNKDRMRTLEREQRNALNKISIYSYNSKLT